MPTLLINNPNSKNDVANWAEFYICAAEESLSKTELSSFIESSSGSEPSETFVDDVWEELIKREIFYGNNPPYIIDFREAVRNIDWRENPAYLVCLILSIDGNSEESTKTGKLFERLSCEAVRNYLNGNAIIYGFPTKQTLEEIATRMNERFNYAPAANFKDRGVDIIGWKPFEDNRKSQIVGLFQCAAGFNWNKKLLDVPIDAWRSYISWSSTLPFKGFITPVVIDESLFHETTLSGGLMIDRTRIYKFIRDFEFLDTALKSELTNWCEERIKSLHD